MFSFISKCHSSKLSLYLQIKQANYLGSYLFRLPMQNI